MKDPLCPFLKKPCIEHDCKMWTHVTGVHPQTGNPLDHWDCSINWIPVMLTEGARMTRGVAASVDSMRNEVVQRQDQLNAAVALGVNREIPPAVTLDNDSRLLRDGSQPPSDVPEDPSVNG